MKQMFKAIWAFVTDTINFRHTGSFTYKLRKNKDLYKGMIIETYLIMPIMWLTYEDFEFALASLFFSFLTMFFGLFLGFLFTHFKRMRKVVGYGVLLCIYFEVISSPLMNSPYLEGMAVNNVTPYFTSLPFIILLANIGYFLLTFYFGAYIIDKIEVKETKNYFVFIVFVLICVLLMDFMGITRIKPIFVQSELYGRMLSFMMGYTMMGSLLSDEFPLFERIQDYAFFEVAECPKGFDFKTIKYQNMNEFVLAYPEKDKIVQVYEHKAKESSKYRALLAVTDALCRDEHDERYRLFTEHGRAYYPSSVVVEAWQELLTNHSHDFEVRRNYLENLTDRDSFKILNEFGGNDIKDKLKGIELEREEDNPLEDMIVLKHTVTKELYVCKVNQINKDELQLVLLELKDIENSFTFEVMLRGKSIFVNRKC